jgi:hypothetical protein
VLYAVKVKGLKVNAYFASTAATQRIIFCNKGSRLV